MSDDLKMVLDGEFNEAIAGGVVALPERPLDTLRLHAVLGGDDRELACQQWPVLLLLRDSIIHTYADRKPSLGRFA